MPLSVPTIPSLPTPSTLNKNVGIVLYYKDKTGFITGATVTFEKILLSPRYATNIGILYYASILKGMAVNIWAQKADIDFGKGKGVKALVGYDLGFDSEIHEFVAKTPFPCPVVTPQIAASNFSNPAATPNITVLPIYGNIPNVGNFNVTEGEYEIQLDDILIKSGSITSVGEGKIDVNLPSIRDISSLIGKISTTVKVIIKWYHCTFTASKTVSLPPIPVPCSGSILADTPNITELLSRTSFIPTTIPVHIRLTGSRASIPMKITVNGTDIESKSSGYSGIDIIRVLTTAGANINQFNTIKIESTATDCNISPAIISIPPLIPALPSCTPPQVYNLITGKCECPPPQVYNLITGKCEPPTPTTCTDIKTTVDSVNHDTSLPSIPSTPFFISINKIKLECPSNSALTKKMTGGTGTVTLGSLSAKFSIPSPEQSDGEVYFDLSKLIDLSKILETTGVVKLTLKINEWVYTRNISLQPPLPELCIIGDEQTVTCPDGTIIVTAKCQKDITTGINKWIPTGKICLPSPPIPELCIIGDEQTVTCPDGTIIVTAKCQKDITTGINKWIPTGRTCLPSPPISEYKIVKILPEGTLSFPKANEGETIKIAATVICKSNSTITKPRDTAYLIIDGVNTDNSLIESGSVTFEWQATATPFTIHTICIKVPPTSACRGYGQDCKKITVSPIILSPAVMLAKERESAREQRKLLEEARQKLRRDIIDFEVTTPTTPPVITPPDVEPPVIPDVEPPVVVPPIIPDVEPPTDTGSIEIIGLPIIITPAIPVYFYIDEILKGRIYVLPKTFDNIKTGIRTVYIKAKSFKSPTKTVIVTKNETSSILL